MGRAGPAAEPIPIRKLKGQTKPSLVGGDIFEADPLEELPRPPEWLSRGARAVWRRVGNELVRYRLDRFSVERSSKPEVAHVIGRRLRDGVSSESLHHECEIRECRRVGETFANEAQRSNIEL